MRANVPSRLQAAAVRASRRTSTAAWAEATSAEATTPPEEGKGQREDRNNQWIDTDDQAEICEDPFKILSKTLSV